MGRPHPDVPRLAGLQTPANLIPQPSGGPENSLTDWDDQGGLETLADYGAVWTFMEFLAGRYGTAFMTDLHNQDANGLPGLQANLDKYLTGDKAQDVVHDWAAMVALDKALDDGAKLMSSAKEQTRFQTPTLHASVHWANPESYSTPGAPPNGSDYVQLRDGGGSAGRGERHQVDPVLEPGEARACAAGVAVDLAGR